MTRAKVLAVALLAGAACGHAPPPVPPSVRAAEDARRDRLPDDSRDLDAKWKDLSVAVDYEKERALAAVDVREPKVRFFYRPDTDEKAAEAAHKAAEAVDENAVNKNAPPVEKVSPDRAVPIALRKVVPFDIQSVAVHGGEITFVDTTKKTKPELWLSKLEVSLENLASRESLSEGRPVLLGAHAQVQSSGDLAVFVSADPWSDSLNFSGRAVLRGLATRDLYGFLAEASDVQMPQGTIDLYVTFAVKDGKITGGVKPLLKNVEVRAADSGAWPRFKAWFADHVIGLFSDRVQRRNAVATVIPLEGTITDPKTDLLTTLAGVLYNAYLKGLAAGFGGLPPASAQATPDARAHVASASAVRGTP